MNKLRLGELFCGPGGIALGACLANTGLASKKIQFLHAWALDNHPDTTKTYMANICGAHSDSVICADVRRYPIEELLTISPIEGFAYGFPCNDFSVVGEHKGFEGSFGPLYTYGLPILSIGKPLFFIAENVGGIRSANEGKAFEKIISDLGCAGDGYILTPHLYKFEEYGVPQARHRVIIVGIRKDLNKVFRPPAPTHSENYVSCFSALTTPPISDVATNNELTRQSEKVVERLKHIKPGENAWTANLPEALKLNVKNTKISQIYKRLDPSKPAYTVTGSGGGGTHVYHWAEHRALTNRERARLQTFPDDFSFHGSKESVRRQIGMAVPPLGAKIIFEAVAKTLAGIDYPSVRPKL